MLQIKYNHYKCSIKTLMTNEKEQRQLIEKVTNTVDINSTISIMILNVNRAN